MNRRLPERKWLVVGGLFVAVVFVLGLVTLAQEVRALVSGKGATKAKEVQTVKKAENVDFDYLVPAGAGDWAYDAASLVFDTSNGVVKYNLRMLGSSQAQVTVSQQQMPEGLKPLDSAKFAQFLASVNATEKGVPVGDGKLFYQSAMMNGQPAGGATTVVYGTDKILLFAKANVIIDYETWNKLIAGMGTVR